MKNLLINPSLNKRPMVERKPQQIPHTTLKEILIYSVAAVMALLVYQGLSQNIEITLKPYVLVIYTLYQLQFEFIPYLGYKETQGLFMIGQECLGGRLFICLFSILTICRLNKYKSTLQKLCAIISFCIISILLAYIITSVRIAASIPFCEMPNFKLIHTILSLIVYFGSGLALYAFLNRNNSKGEMDFEYKQT